MTSGRTLYRALLAGWIFALLALSLPHAAAAAPAPQVTLTFDVVGVKEGESVTIRTKDFPVRTNFVARIDKVGRQGRGGAQVDAFNSAAGGVIEKTFTIPEGLREELILAVRLESSDGYVAHNWFINENMAYRPERGAAKPELAFSGVKKGALATVEGKNFPPGYTFSVRVGPYHTFYRDYVFIDSVRSGDDGALKFELAIPEAFQEAEYIMVRLDGGGLFAFNTFQNVDGGAAAPVAKLYKFEWCRVIATKPVPALAPGEHFDAVWTVQNTSNIEWVDSEPDYQYRFVGGEAMHKYEQDRYVFPATIGKGQIFDVAVDMIAPDTFAGWHSAAWAITQGEKEMCRLPIMVFVKDQ